MTLSKTPLSSPNDSSVNTMQIQGDTSTSTSSKSTTPFTPSVTPLQLSFAAIILGASAGLTFYTKRTSSMLNQMERMSQSAKQRRGPPKFGPKTRLEWERSRNRWEKDDL